MNKIARDNICLFFALAFLFVIVSSCTPVLVGGALAGGGYAGYKAHESGYRINVTKEAKGTKVKKDSSKKPDANNKGAIINSE